MASEVTGSGDDTFLLRALELARRGTGYVSPNPRVGCVIVHRGVIVAEGWHAEYGGLHAEAMALNTLDGAYNPSNCTLYVTLEPCNHVGKQPACSAAIIRSGIRRVVVGMRDPNPHVEGGGAQALVDAGVSVMHASSGVTQQCRWLNRFWTHAVTTGRPYIILKIAQSADGYMCLPDRSRLQLTGPETQARVHALRAEVDAVLVGMGTVRSDNPQLTVRLVEGRTPRRVIVGQRTSLPSGSFIAQTMMDTPTYFIERDTSLASGFERLLVEQSIQSILCEPGPTIAQLLLDQGLVDELHLHTSSRMLGNGIGVSLHAHEWTEHSTEQVGTDVITTFLKTQS